MDWMTSLSGAADIERIVKYTCTEQVSSMGIVLIAEGQVVESGQRIQSGGLAVELTQEVIGSWSKTDGEPLFRPMPEPITISSRPHEAMGEEEPRDWIVEMRVTTTRTRLRAIEEFISSRVPDML